MKKMPFIITIIALLLIGCVKNTEIELPTSPPKLVINALFSPDSIWSVEVSKSASPTDTNKILPPVNNASVELWENEDYKGKFDFSGGGVYKLQAYPQEGKKYRIKVSSPDFEGFVEAIDSIPKIDSVAASWDLSQKVPFISEGGYINMLTPVSIKIKDVENQKNYYLVQEVRYDSCYLCMEENTTLAVTDFLNDIEYKYFFEEKEPAVEKVFGHTTGLIRDIHFSNEVYRATFYSEDTTIYRHSTPRHYWNTPQFVYLVYYADISSISETMFKYYMSYYQQSYNIGDPFATPINVYSNVKGGFGVFAGYQRKRILLYKG